MRLIEEFLRPVSEEKPVGEFLYYEELYSRIQEAARADDMLPKGIWSFEEKAADWKQVAVLCEEGLERKTKDLNIAGWLVQAWMHLYGLAGATRGMRLFGQLCEKYWDDVFPSVEADGDATFRISSLSWLVKKASLQLRQMPLFVSKIEMKPALSIYHYIVVARMMQSGQEPLPEHEEIKSLWNESAHFSSLEMLQEIRAKFQELSTCVKAIDQFLSEKITQDGVSFSLLYNEIDKGLDAVNSIELIKKEAKQKKELQQKEQAAAPEEVVKEEEVAPQEDLEQKGLEAKEVESQEPAHNKPAEDVVEEEIVLQEVVESRENIKEEMMTSAQVYERVRHLLQTLNTSDPQNPIADLLLLVLNYQRLPFRDLIKKYAPKGALSRVHSILEQDVVS